MSPARIFGNFRSILHRTGMNARQTKLFLRHFGHRPLRMASVDRGEQLVERRRRAVPSKRMKLCNIQESGDWFRVLLTSKKSQVATMTLAPGKASGPKGNEHPKSEQVLFVVEGEVLAEIGQEKQTLRRGDVVIVPAGADHRFVNHSGSTAMTLNVYAPPAYDSDEG